MIGDPRYSRFFAVMALFTFAMVMLVMSNNLLVTYMCWEVMGICSYLLISHWAHRQAACRAATKAFLVNAVADVGLGFGVILTFATYRTLDIQQILSAASSVVTTDINLLAWFGFDYAVAPNTLITLCLLIGALGKSARFQCTFGFPSQGGPNPCVGPDSCRHDGECRTVSAGPLSPLVLLAPNIMIVIAIVGATTALYGGLVSLTQPDIKKLLAYSTISQIGFMVFLCGIGAFVAAIFHLLAHGFLKGFLFLSTGNALNSASSHSHTEGDGHVPTGGVARSGLFGALLLACIPPFLLFSGPYERMWSATNCRRRESRLGDRSEHCVFDGKLHVSAVMSLFQQTLSGPAAVRPTFVFTSARPQPCSGGGASGRSSYSFWSWFTAFLAPALGAQQVSLEELSPGGGYSPWLVLPLLAAIGGWSLSYYVHLTPSPTSLGRGEWARTAYVFLLNKLYVDEIYEACVVQPVIRFSRWLWRDVDVRGIDGAIRAVAGSSRHFSRWLGGSVEARGVDGAIRAVAGSSRHFSRWLGGSVEARGVDGSIRGIASSALRLSSWLWTAIEVRTGDRPSEAVESRRCNFRAGCGGSSTFADGSGLGAPGPPRGRRRRGASKELSRERFSTIWLSSSFGWCWLSVCRTGLHYETT